jgi:phage shock protein PspC (stress-responsive transcriptional regulator)
MPDPSKPIRRSRKERLLAGVCGGLAEWLGWDVSVVRVLYVLVSVTTAAFPGILAYVILWLILPEAEVTVHASVPVPETGAAKPQPGA